MIAMWRTASRLVHSPGRTPIVAATVSGSEYSVRHQVPTDIGEPGLTTRSM
jgi:hypothetical protein